MTTQCNCEHVRHPIPQPQPSEFDDPEDFVMYYEAWRRADIRYPYPRIGHVYMSVPAGSQRAEYVGEICDWCATYCLSEYLI